MHQATNKKQDERWATVVNYTDWVGSLMAVKYNRVDPW